MTESEPQPTSTCSICGDPAPLGACCGGYVCIKSKRLQTEAQSQEAPERIWMHVHADADCWCSYHYEKADDPQFLTEYARVHPVNDARVEEIERLNLRIAELERRLKIPFGKLPCALCGGPHGFDTSVPSVIWNSVIRAKNLPDYLCTTCIVREFVREGQGFTATLWNEEFNGIPIEIVVNGQNARDAAAVQEENNSLRNQLSGVKASSSERRCGECEADNGWHRTACSQHPRFVTPENGGTGEQL